MERDLTVRGRVFTFLAFRRNSLWLVQNPVAFAFALIYQIINVLAIVTSIVALVVASEPSFYTSEPFAPNWYLIIEIITVVFFTVDYLLKLITVPNPSSWVFQFLPVCDLLSFLPSYIDWIVQVTQITVLFIKRVILILFSFR